MKIGFIGLGNVGGKLAGSLLRDGFDLTVRDLDEALVQSFVERGATSAASPKEMAETVDLIITCLHFMKPSVFLPEIPLFMKQNLR